MPVKRTRPPARHGLARALSRRGVCSRSEAARWIAAGRVSVAGHVRLDPEFPTTESTEIAVDGAPLARVQRCYVALNKPRGLITTTTDERGRDTVYRCFDGASLPWLAPVGRLDKASEGLLLFCNDPRWADAITDPLRGPGKTYHVQVDRIPDAASLASMVAGMDVEGDRLRAASARLLRTGDKHAWLEIVLDEGRNRQIRRLLEALDIRVLRLVRVAIGPVELGDLAKGAWRVLDEAEVRALVAGS
jgi:23S rRNA pseudouridine2605 synthase